MIVKEAVKLLTQKEAVRKEATRPESVVIKSAAV